jgi:non-ribosomal peptide synthetase component F/acyl carrier protein
MVKRDFEAINPLSPAQQGMLYEYIRAPESGIHIEQSVYTLKGEMNIAAFEQAWQWGVDRHAILRTGFVWKEQAEPLQVTLRHVHIAIDYRDWRHISSAEQQAQLKSYLRDDRARGFNVAQAPLMRLTLFRLSEQIYRFVWTSHHILMDGWSHQILLNEIISCYTALSRGQTFSAQSGRPYSDYIEWLERQDVSKAEGFWRKMLHGFTRTTPLGIEQASVVADEPEGHDDLLEFQLSDAVTSALQSVARSHHLTLNTLLQGLWAILLSRYSQSEDVVFGVTVSGRPADMVGIEQMVGLCINTLPLRVQLSARAPLWSWLSDLQRLNLEMHHYEYCSAGQVHRWSDMPGMSLLYESLLVVENYPSTVTSTSLEIDVSIDDVFAIGAQTKYALTILVSTGARLGVRCIYNRYLFPRSSARYVMEHLQRLLEYIASDPQGQLATLSNWIPADQIPIVRSANPVVQEELISNYVAPRNPMEELIAAVWCDVLGMLQVSVESDFFKLGGHSLVATQMISRLRTLLNVEIPLRAVFESPTVAGLALRVEQALRKREGVEAPPLLVAKRPEQLPLSFAQQRLWFLNQLAPDSTAYLTPSVLRIKGQINVSALERSVQELVSRHESLRTVFVEHTGQPMQVIKPAGQVRLPVIDLRGLQNEQRTVQTQQLAAQERLRPCDLTLGPLLRLYLLRVEPGVQVLLLTLHHIITDGWSTGVLVRELITLYRAFVVDQPLPLPPLPLQYADYALWQRQWLQGEVLQRQIAYWKKQLWKVPPLELPTDVPRAVAQGNDGAIYSYQFSTELWKDLVSLSRQEGVTLFMLLLTIFQVVLYRLSGQTDIVLGTDVANRSRAELEGLIGFFVNLLALRTDLRGAPSFRKVVQHVRATVLDAYSHQELPFELVVEHVQGKRDEARTPLVQALFVMQNTPQVKEELPGVTFEIIQDKNITAKFDLAVFVYESEHNLMSSVVYRTALFKEQTIVSLLRHFEILARSAIAEPETSIDELEMYSDVEKDEQAKYEKKLYQAGSNSWRDRKTSVIDLSAFAFEQKR